MKTAFLVVLGALSASIVCTAADARGITINDWGDPSNGGTESILPTATSVATTNLSAIGISTSIALSFMPGVTTAPIYDDTGGGPNLEEFAWGANTNPNLPTAQVILAGTSATTFQLSIGYSDPVASDPYAASVSLGGTKYTATLTSDSLGDNYLNFSYVGGAWAVTGESANDWKESGGPAAAPEIDPASAISALTLLAGATAILGGWVPRRRHAPARA